MDKKFWIQTDPQYRQTLVNRSNSTEIRSSCLHVPTTKIDLPLDLAVNLDGELGEVLQHLAHLVAALPAPHVDDDVRVGVFGQRLRDHGLAASERSRNGSRAALEKKSIYFEAWRGTKYSTHQYGHLFPIQIIIFTKFSSKNRFQRRFIFYQNIPWTNHNST